MRNLLIAMSILALAFSAPAGAEELKDWTLQRDDGGKKYNVTVPSTVAGALNQAGVFGKDVLNEDNYKGIDKTQFDVPWVYTTRFATQKGQCYVLRFEGLNFYADIELNGKKLASADTTAGTFCIREFDVTKLVKGKNTLKVTLRRPQSGDLNHGYVDWNPRPVDESMGIIRPVVLIATPDVQVQDVFVKPIVNTLDLSSAKILVNCCIVNRSSRAVDGALRGTWDNGVWEVPVSLAPGETREVKVEKTVENPRLWWPREMGSPELYHMNVAFAKGEKVSHSKDVTFGIRDIQGYINQFGYRQFAINGRKLLIKGAGWTDDIFMQDTPESIRAQLEMVADMGLNLVRFEDIWGKDDTVYDLCDQMGLLALVGWSCQWEWEDYCGLKETKGYGCINDPRSEAFAVRYFHDQLIRLRNHPAIIGWLTGSDRIPNPRLEEQYLALYNKLEYRPYVCSAQSLTSLAGPSGTKMTGPYEYVGPDYWWVDKKVGGAFGFNTETNPGINLPQVESLKKIVGEDQLWPMGENWNYHCTSSSSHMNNMEFQKNAMAATYGEAGSLEDYVRKAHALEYDSVKAMYEAFRCNVPLSTGVVHWMLNSAWPSMYWQLYDWYGIPTSGYYGTKKGTQPIQLVFNYADNTVWVVNDVVHQARLTATLKVYDVNSKLIREESREIMSIAREPARVFEAVAGPAFVALELKGDFEADNFYCIPAKGAKYNWKKSDWWGIPAFEYANLDFVSALPEAKVQMELTPTEYGCDVKLTNLSDVIAYQNILKAKDSTGDLIPGVFWSDNFFTLVPGQSKVVTCKLPKGCETAKIELAGWNAK